VSKTARGRRHGGTHGAAAVSHDRHPLGRYRVGLEPAPAPALHLIAGVWVASCSGCGYELVHHVSQQRAEEQAAGRRCPICLEVA
jgi:hypothetical protein